MSRLPDDWAYHYARCGICGQSYHPSGVDVCACDVDEPLSETGYDADDHNDFLDEDRRLRKFSEV